MTRTGRPCGLRGRNPASRPRRRSAAREERLRNDQSGGGVRGGGFGIKLEVVDGLTVWEGSPVYRHQKAIRRIEGSVRRTGGAGSDCGCYAVADVGILFPDGSKKRPDISVFCVEPPEDGDIQLIPEAVIEVLSTGYEKKDTEVGAPFCLKVGVKDVILFEPRSGAVTHLRRDGRNEFTSPVHIALECGCVCTV